MNIGFCYDTVQDYEISPNNLEFCDFASAESISYVKKILEHCGHKVILIGNYKRLCERLDMIRCSCDLVYSTAEGLGSRNREGWIPSLLEMNQICYVGTDAYGLSLTLDKVQTKIIASHLEIPTASFCEFFSEDDMLKKAVNFSYPKIIKPNYEGSSMGVRLVNSPNELINECKINFERYKQKMICEDYLPGKELTTSICVIDGIPQVVGMAETVNHEGKTMDIFSSKVKRIYGCKKRTPNITDEQKRQIEAYSLHMFNYIGCKDYCRIDFRFDEKGVPNLLEVTPLPALGETASFTAGVLLNGHTADWLFNNIINSACQRYGLLPET